jgi:hypothetical protein
LRQHGLISNIIQLHIYKQNNNTLPRAENKNSSSSITTSDQGAENKNYSSSTTTSDQGAEHKNYSSSTTTSDQGAENKNNSSSTTTSDQGTKYFMPNDISVREIYR